jgi:alpha-L-fucosidase
MATLKTNRLFLHVFDRPKNGVVFVPSFSAIAKRASFLVNGTELKTTQDGADLKIFLPLELPDARDSVVAVDFDGTLTNAWKTSPQIISRAFGSFAVDADKSQTNGQATLDSVTSSQYFGNWKHDKCIKNMSSPTDRAEFSFRFLEPGDYRVTLEYACPAADKGREGIVEIAGQLLGFESLLTGEYNSHEPLLFIRQNVGVVSIKEPGAVTMSVHPKNDGGELFWLRRVLIEPVQ